MIAVITWDDGERLETTLTEFIEANAETFGDEEIEKLQALAPGESTYGGGGAQPAWTLTVSEDPSRARCVECRGSGHDPHDEAFPCTACRGEGRVDLSEREESALARAYYRASAGSLRRCA